MINNMIKNSINKLLSIKVSSKIFCGFITFITNLLQTRVFNSRASRGPLFVTWLVTFDCNIACRFCSTHSLKNKYSENISKKRALALAHEIGKAQTWVVGFTGGEVLLWPHLFDVIKVLKKYNINVYVVTNGLLLKDKVEDILKSGLDSVVVSIDSNIASEHDYIRNCPSLYNKIMEAIEYLKMKRKNNTPLIKATTVLTRYSLPKIETIIREFEKIVDVTSFQPLACDYSNSPHGRSEKNIDDLKYEGSEKESVEMLINKLINARAAFNNKYYKLIPEYWLNKDSLKRIKCWSPFLRLQILPNGDVFQCTANPRYGVVGNINKSSLMDIWNSNELRKQREEIRLHKNDCICWTQDTSFNAIIDSLPLANCIPNLNRNKVT
jgi:radical SAM protein with 4Fe4S-binding SPASM domain